jgi:hypothetical protein
MITALPLKREAPALKIPLQRTRQPRLCVGQAQSRNSATSIFFDRPRNVLVLPFHGLQTVNPRSARHALRQDWAENKETAPLKYFELWGFHVPLAKKPEAAQF